MLPNLDIDPVVRREFITLSDLSFLGEAWGPIGYLVARIAGPAYQFMTRATLPAEFREMMDWSWTAEDERKLQRVLKLIRVADGLVNPAAVRLVYRLQLIDFRLRRRLGIPVLGKTRVIDTLIRDGGGARWLARKRITGNPQYSIQP